MGSSEWKLAYIWTYHNGQWGETPLKFGTTSKGQIKSHINNSGRYYIGYSNTFSFEVINIQDPYDVAYNFIVSDGALLVDIDISNTNFDGNLYLLRKIGSAYELIKTDPNKASPSISEVLEEGTYYVVFEGQGQIRPQVGYTGIEGQFKISIDGIEPELTAGSIVNNSPYVNNGYSITQGISNVNGATTTYDTFTYSWYKKIDNNNPTWELIPGASNENLTAAELETLSGKNVYIKRRVSQLDFGLKLTSS